MRRLTPLPLLLGSALLLWSLHLPWRDAGDETPPGRLSGWTAGVWPQTSPAQLVAIAAVATLCAAAVVLASPRALGALPLGRLGLITAVMAGWLVLRVRGFAFEKDPTLV